MIFCLETVDAHNIAGAECRALTLCHNGGLNIFFFSGATQLPLPKRKSAP